jgi:hypothetical protein
MTSLANIFANFLFRKTPLTRLWAVRQVCRNAAPVACNAQPAIYVPRLLCLLDSLNDSFSLYDN